VGELPGGHQACAARHAAARPRRAALHDRVALSRDRAVAVRGGHDAGARAGGAAPFFFLGLVGIFVSTQGSYLAIALSTASNIILLQAASR
jgi:hypothetical protein